MTQSRGRKEEETLGLSLKYVGRGSQVKRIAGGGGILEKEVNRRMETSHMIVHGSKAFSTDRE